MRKPPDHANLPFWYFKPPPNYTTYIKRGSRIGLLLAGAMISTAVTISALTGAIADFFLSELVPGLDIAIDCLTLVAIGVLLVVGFYTGLLVASIVYAVNYAAWKAKQKPPE